MAENKLGARTALLFVIALLFVLLVQGAIPFLTAPTLGQAIWSMGFSQSFLNESVFSIYAHNFGAPEPAAIAFGLAGAWPAAMFIKLGLQPIDAYTSMVALWLTIAFVSAYKMGRYFSVSSALAILGAVAWGTMPVIWAHSGYSMLSTGIALLPFYFLAAFHLFFIPADDGWPRKREAAKKIACYMVVCLIAIFMDGYSFMMFAVGGTMLGAVFFVREEKKRKRLLQFSFPAHLACLVIAYLLYALYTGKAQFERAPIDFFRGWGVDIMYMLIPTQGIHWLPDVLGGSVPRSVDMFFGDTSVWMTSFSFPVIVGAIWAAIYGFGKRGVTLGFILIAAFGFYMALGPSLKVNSVKPIEQVDTQMMAAEYAVAPTGSALLSKSLPGFRNMRASYRWIALGIFASWGLLLLVMANGNKRIIVIWARLIVGVVIVLNLPNLPQKLENDIGNRAMFLDLESELIDGMREVVSPNEKVAFLPWRNDFLVNYAAARLNIVAFNIGGDKNLAEARSHWPVMMRHFRKATVDRDFSDRILLLLAKKEVDVVILPYIDMLWAAHEWPYPVEFKDELAPVVKQLIRSGFVRIDERDFYAAVRLKPEFSRMMQRGVLEQSFYENFCIPPVCLRRNDFGTDTLSLAGTVHNGQLLSNGNAGFLHFGPYVPMEGGRYQLVVHGVAESASSAWVDVVSNKGTVEHGKFELLNGTAHGDGILARGEVRFDKAADDVEIRVYVGAADKVTVSSYELVRLQEP